MGWFSNKKEEKELETSELPELPDLPDNFSPPLEDDFETFRKPLSVEVEPLSRPQPSRIPPPITPRRSETFNQEQIKRAVNEKDRSFGEMQRSKFEINPSRVRELQFEAPEYETPKLGKNILRKNVPVKSIGKRGEAVYVRVDKFESALDIIEEIKAKISSIERALDKTRKINEQEEAEIQSWETEIQNIKLKLESIDKEIFNDIE